MSAVTDWEAWHQEYTDPGSPLSERLRIIQAHIDAWLDATAGPVSVVSACPGDGRDLLGVLERRPDAHRVSATLIESDAHSAQRAAAHADRLDLPAIDVRCTDAGSTSAYVEAVPADLVLLCGIFGNIPDGDIYTTIAALAQFCSPQALVLWTRHRKDPDLTPHIRTWFGGFAFDEVDFTAPEHAWYSVGVHRFTGAPEPLRPEQHLFTFFR